MHVPILILFSASLALASPFQSKSETDLTNFTVFNSCTGLSGTFTSGTARSHSQFDCNSNVQKVTCTNKLHNSLSNVKILYEDGSTGIIAGATSFHSRESFEFDTGDFTQDFHTVDHTIFVTNSEGRTMQVATNIKCHVETDINGQIVSNTCQPDHFEITCD